MESVWANRLNLAGLYSPFPIKCHIKESIWIDEEELDVERLGLTVKGSTVTYAAESKENVEAWTLGVLATFKLLHKWTSFV